LDAALCATSVLNLIKFEPLYVNAGEEKKGRGRKRRKKKEEGRGWKGREFIPVGMALLVTLIIS
jgi:hypothetical protein